MNREDYLINILRLTENGSVAKTTELASYMGVSPASVSEMIKVLSADGLVNYEKYRGVTLTDDGMTYARQIRKRHHVLETFLMEYLELDHQAAHEEACRMEHAISDESARKMCQMMGSNVDSDCSSCQEPCKAATEGSSRFVALNTLSKDQSGKISYIKSDDNELVKRIVSIGIVPGKIATLDGIISDGGPRMVRIGSSTMVVDYDMAECIFVDLSPISLVRIDQ
ncbi:MAG: metal-dependent transcriptional regulator [Candidatus Methanomethylophilaceae archaeon]|nr:metal-dependent transcriptional regulator [Candidatus Methanomethylophilaceae archaeon]